MAPRSLASLADAFEREGVPGLAPFAAAPPSEPWLDELVHGSADPRASIAATWLLKAYLERGAELTRPQTAALLRALERVPTADARLHLCQLIGHLDVPRRNAEQLARFLRNGAAGDHKLIRAWAVDGLHRLGLQHREYHTEARLSVDRASRDAAASVRARARNIQREAGWGGGAGSGGA
ncbi:MAG: hypothetical protein AAF682_07840 [Planctomycetota bacterium]